MRGVNELYWPCTLVLALVVGMAGIGMLALLDSGERVGVVLDTKIGAILVCS